MASHHSAARPRDGGNSNGYRNLSTGFLMLNPDTCADLVPYPACCLCNENPQPAGGISLGSCDVGARLPLWRGTVFPPQDETILSGIA